MEKETQIIISNIDFELKLFSGTAAMATFIRFKMDILQLQAPGRTNNLEFEYQKLINFYICKNE